MSDLSRMLDDIYAVPDAEGSDPDDGPTRAPAWSSEEALDEAFASWIPGSSEEAPALERSLVAAGTAELSPLVTTPERDTWLMATEPAPIEATPERAARWSPSDDDILPARRRSRRSVRP